jgi:hypothetical protein
MSNVLTPELGVPLPDDAPYLDLRARAEAACNTLDDLQELGADIPPPNAEDQQIATALATSYAADPDKTSKEVSKKALKAPPTPASLLATRAILDEFGHAVVKHAVEIRNTVTNKLILESENPDPRVRIRALELLGKISDVGLFSEKQEITVTHQTTDELRQKLRDKLNKLMEPIDVETVDVRMDGEVIDIEAEMGLKPESEPENDEKQPEDSQEQPQNNENQPQNNQTQPLDDKFDD